MKYDRMIIGWNGLLPIVVDIPVNEFIWDKVECFMDIVRKMGTDEKNEMVFAEV